MFERRKIDTKITVTHLELKIIQNSLAKQTHKEIIFHHRQMKMKNFFWGKMGKSEIFLFNCFPLKNNILLLRKENGENMEI